MPHGGSAGGPTAGERFLESQREPESTCVYCGVKTTKEPGPRQYNADHGIPRSENGNRTEANRNNACFKCNNEKRNLDAPTYMMYKMFLQLSRLGSGPVIFDWQKPKTLDPNL